MRTHLDALWAALGGYIERLRRSEDGYTTETVVVTAILVALVLLVVGTILWDKVVAKANSINLG